MNKQPLVLKRGDGETLEALGSRITFLSRAPGAWSLMQVTAPPDVGPPPHEHDFDEAYFLLSGSLRFTVAGEELALGAGDFVHVPGGVAHGFKGGSDGVAQLLIFQAPGDADEFFRAVARELTNMPADMRRVPEIAARHGIRMTPSSCAPQR
jgi:quercetin dioxygenase-like cupin family protein